jgi:hypothetical protein
MKKLLAVVFCLLAPLGCHSDSTDPDCVRIEAACANATTPAQESCHELVHDNPAQCAARVTECVATCGGGGSADAGTATDAPASGG